MVCFVIPQKTWSRTGFVYFKHETGDFWRETNMWAKKRWLSNRNVGRFSAWKTPDILVNIFVGFSVTSCTCFFWGRSLIDESGFDMAYAQDTLWLLSLAMEHGPCIYVYIYIYICISTFYIFIDALPWFDVPIDDFPYLRY